MCRAHVLRLNNISISGPNEVSQIYLEIPGMFKNENNNNSYTVISNFLANSQLVNTILSIHGLLL